MDGVLANLNEKGASLFRIDYVQRLLCCDCLSEMFDQLTDYGRTDGLLSASYTSR